MIKAKLGQTTSILEDIEKSRIQDLEEVFKKTNDDKNKLVEIIKDISISYEEERKKFEQLEADLIRQYDFSIKFDSFKDMLKANDEKYDNLNKENEVLRKQLKDLNEKVFVGNAQILDLNDKIAGLVRIIY